ncbi:MAG: MSEP-CTERM sorting domain-containing protein [Tannerellaceae bacterium]|nr:MSEP-CTERM sorting domain-containing protein [Tannerellaceae bacterium]
MRSHIIDKETGRTETLDTVVVYRYGSGLFYLLGVWVVPLWSNLYFGNEHIFILFLVLGICLFLFFIFRLCYVYYEKKSIHSRYGLWIKIPVGIVFPVAGLALNSVIGLFGNYDSPWFYILAVVNGILITVPAPQKLSDRFVLYIFRCITFAFTFYFFIVFLPFTPISVALIPLLGLGLLLVTPIILFVIHGTILADDYKQLKTGFRPFLLLGTGIAAFFVLPVALTISMYNDKKILHSSLEYVYSPDYTKEYKLKPASIQKTLEIAESTRKRDAIYSSTPYISSWYRYIVLDNMTLSYAKRKLLSGIFTDEDLHRSLTFESNRTHKEKDIRIINAEHSSEYDSGKGVWVSKIDLHIENFSDTRWNTEYITYLDLPDGCWISDYYLFVGDVQEPGILAERKAATWVFDRIRERHFDPGLLRYVGGNTVEFKVFPFEQGEVRRTGIEFIHIDPVDIRIDDYTIRLGEDSHAVYEYAPAFLSQDDGLVHLSAYEKAQLQTGTPEPYFHFIVDVSKHNNIPANDKIVTEELMRKYEQYIGNVLENSPFTAVKYKVTYANSTYYTEQYSINEQVSLSLKNYPDI